MSSKKKISLRIDPVQEKKWDSTFQKMEWWDSKKISAAKVMVVGAGALGNEVLKNLALLNVGNILIIDFDTIEYANLNRSILFRESDCHKNKAKVAALQIKNINPNISVQYINGDIAIDVGLGVFRRMDVIISCLDNRVARLFINRHCYKVGKTWIDGAIENLGGQTDVFKPSISCYECQLSAAEMKMISYRLGCADVAKRSANVGSIATTPISSSIIGAVQVQEALKVIQGKEKNSLIGNRFRYYGATNEVLYTKTPKIREECDSHVSFESIFEANDLSCKQSIREVLTWLKKHFKSTVVRILLDEEIVLKIVSSSGPSHDVAILKYHISDEIASKYRTDSEEDLHFENRTMILDDNFPYPDLSLNDVGIPPLQILKIETNDDIHFVELTGDLGFLSFN